MATHELFQRCPQNPIIQAHDVPRPCKTMCNPAAHFVDGEVVLLLRAIDDQNCSRLTVARSRNGISDWRFDKTPLLDKDDPPRWYENQGCEDARITFLPERDEYVIAYVGASDLGSGVCLATTHDFRRAERIGLVIQPYNKDAALFPRKIGGRYCLLHRPTAGPLEDIWLSESEDLIHWGHPRCVLRECDQPGWDNGKVGTGPPPIETPEGWLLIFHGVQQTEKGWLYRVGLALFDLEDPGKVIARSPNWVFGPNAPYEANGKRPGIIFPTGTIQKDGQLHLYYGAADTCVALATAPMDALMDEVRRDRV